MTSQKTDLFSLKQLDAYMHATARINILEGAVRSGKSYIALFLFLRMLREGPDGPYIICGKSERTVLRNVIDPMNSLCRGIIRYNRGMGEFRLFGKTVHVVGANDERAEGKIRGASYAGALVDEISILPVSFFKMLLSRLSIPGAKLIGTTNPDSPFHWLKTEYIDNENVVDKKVFKFTIDDNPALTEDFKDNIKREYTGLWYRRFIDGQWVQAEGAIYDFFDDTHHAVNRPPTYAKTYILGIDYGTTNAFAAVLIGYNDQVSPRLWVEKEYYYDSKKMGAQLTDSEYAQAIKREFGDYPIKITYVDPAAISFLTELRRAKWRAMPADNSVIDGIRFVSSLFCQGDLVVLKSCKNLIREIQSYVWDERSFRLGIDEPLKKNDHAVDACRYALYSHFGQKDSISEPQQQLSPEQRAFYKNPMGHQGFGPGDYGWRRVG